MNKANYRVKLKNFLKKEILAFEGFFTPLEKTIVFDSFKARQYSDNPRAISEKMHELFPAYKLVWVLQKDFNGEVPDYVEICEKDSRKYRRAMATCFAYVRNEAIGNDMYKRKGQLYIQTWHGDRGIKKILYDAWDNGKRPFPVMDEKLTDLFVLGSDYAEKRIQTAFRYHGEVIKTGCPRNDCLIHPRNTETVRKRIGVDSGKKLLLYAPTLRRNTKVVQATVDIEETLRHLNRRGGEWVCLVRAHPKSLGVDVGAGTNIMNVSQYPDMADLLMIADCLITDYSSCAGDFALRKKPLFLAQFDLEQYMEQDRTFHVDINEIGYLIARTQDELDRLIDTMTDEQFAANCEKVLSYFGTQETGHAAEDVCRWIDSEYTLRRLK